MLGVLEADGQGAADLVLVEVAQRLAAEGLRVVGAVQENIGTDCESQCDMYLRLLCGSGTIKISQNLGAGSTGCRLYGPGVEEAAGLAGVALSKGADLMIVNKFGKQEAEGGGFRQLIGQALSEGVPVLIAVKPDYLAAFEGFAEGLSEPLPSGVDPVIGWVRDQRAMA